MKKEFTVTNDEDTRFTVSLIREGDRYGLNGCITHVRPNTLVEFWNDDGSYFISRYDLSTLQEHFDDDNGGLWLNGDDTSHTVTRDNLGLILLIEKFEPQLRNVGLTVTELK